MELEFKPVSEKPKSDTLCLLRMRAPSGKITYVTGWFTDCPESYEWECNMEDTHHGGRLEAPYDVIEWAYLE